MADNWPSHLLSEPENTQDEATKSPFSSTSVGIVLTNSLFIRFKTNRGFNSSLLILEHNKAQILPEQNEKLQQPAHPTKPLSPEDHKNE